MIYQWLREGVRSLVYLTAICIVIILQVPLEARAQNFTVRVLVTAGDNGAPLVGANVILRSSATDKVIRGGSTNKDGVVNYHSIASGTYDLRISYIGYETHTEDIRLDSNRVNVKRITLAVANSQLQGIVVSAKREVETGNAGITKISSEDIANVPTPGAGGDLASYLQNIPGIITVGDRGGGFHVRGGTPNENKVLVDNIPVVKPFHISNLFSAFPDKLISTVDLYRGGYDAQYYGVTSAVMDVSLRPGNFKEYEGGGAIGTYLSSFRAEGPINKDTDSFLLMGRKSLIDQTSSHLTDNYTPTNFYDITARYSLKKGNYRCNATALHTYDNGQINPARSFNLSWTNTAMGARCLGFSEKLDFPLEVTAGFSRFHNDVSSNQKTSRSSSISNWYFTVEHKETISGLPINYGMKLNNRRYKGTLKDKFTDFFTYDEYSPSLYLYGSTVFDVNKFLRIKSSVGFLGIFDTRLAIVPSLEPRLRLSYRPDGTNNQEVSLALGKYSQLNTSLTDELDAGTNFRALRSGSFAKPIQTALHVIASYSRKMGAHFKWKIEGYLKEYSNISVSKFTPVAQLEVETIKADGRAYGVDFASKYQKESFFFSLGYGYSHVRYDANAETLGEFVGGDDFRSVLSYNPAQDQRHKLNAQIGYKVAGFNTSVRWQFGSGKPYTKVYGFDLGIGIPFENPSVIPGTARTLYSKPYGERLPSYHRLDISVKRIFNLSQQWAVTTEFGAVNVYNRKNIFYFDANSQQRVNQSSFLPYLSLRVNFK